MQIMITNGRLARTRVMQLSRLQLALAFATLATQAKGAAKETVGRLLNDRDLEAEGNADRADGKVQEGFGKVKRKVGEAIEDIGEIIRK